LYASSSDPQKTEGETPSLSTLIVNSLRDTANPRKLAFTKGHWGVLTLESAKIGTLTCLTLGGGGLSNAGTSRAR
jgi:hypothetical protein